MPYSEKDIVEAYELLMRYDDHYSFTTYSESFRRKLGDSGLPITVVAPNSTPEEIERKISEREKEVYFLDAKNEFAELQARKAYIGFTPEDKIKDIEKYLTKAGKTLADLDPSKTEAQIKQDIEESAKRCHLVIAREHYTSLIKEASSPTLSHLTPTWRIDAIQKELNAAKATLSDLDSSKSKDEIEGEFKKFYVDAARKVYERIKGYNKEGTQYHHSHNDELDKMISKAGIDIQDLDPSQSRESIFIQIHLIEISTAQKLFQNLKNTTSTEQIISLEYIKCVTEKIGLGHCILDLNKSEDEIKAELAKYEPRTFSIPELRSWQYLPLIDGKSYIVSGQYLAQNTKVNVPHISYLETRTIDWNHKDDYTKAVTEATDAAIKALGSDPTAAKLLGKPQWTRLEREIWELTLAQKMGEAVQSIKLISEYRTSGKSPVKPEESLNKATMQTEFDCSEMSITKAAIAQNIENHFLEAGTGYKSRTCYYRATGIWTSPGEEKGGRHAWIVSEATSGVIEATSSSYNRNDNLKYTFAHFLAGYPLVTPTSTYTPANFVGIDEQYKVAAQRLESLQSGDLHALQKTFSTTSIGIDNEKREAAAMVNNKKFNPDIVSAEPSAAYDKNKDQIQKLHSEVDKCMSPTTMGFWGKEITGSELEAIKKSFGEKNITYTNNSGSVDFISYNGIKVPMTFANDVPETKQNQK